MATLKTDELFSSIREDIITGRIPLNTLILEQSIAEHYGVSKMTAREALQRLCNEKYLKNFPRKGYLINDISFKQSVEIQQVRYQIEALAIRLVIRNCSDSQIESLKDVLASESSENNPYDTVSSKFHLAIALLSGNEYIYESLHRYIGYVCRFALTPVFKLSVQNYESMHEEIVYHMLKRDEAAALEALRLDVRLDLNEV